MTEPALTTPIDPRELVKKALDAFPEAMVADSWLGPRSTEVGFTTTDGRTIVLVVKERAVI